MRLTLSLLCVFVVCALCTAQEKPPDIPEIAAHAGIICRATVLSVATETAQAPGEVARVRITIRVEDAIKGATTGQILIIRQWNVMPDEYRIGETLLLFLHSPSEELRLTSAVGGSAGHRRVEEVPADLLNSLRTPATLASTAPAPAQPPQRPSRTARP